MSNDAAVGPSVSPVLTKRLILPIWSEDLEEESADGLGLLALLNIGVG